ncbi:response regulator transcription factor [Leptolyngbya sp. FACHB-261]|uniref:response regulator transcription factor n=1 Tax=Leptolyngbya sp. FACHB-261 TaxID=2692806 RepID=UPI0016828C2E|nr:response regulator transcription factor [Leptolyngbya sp. FACHB-261]MBD2101425.1 response regulator transcription factor [Leptolyngbya sp. FACHB-261]
MTRVLVVDDDLEFAEILRILLEARGYKVQIAQDGLEALDILKDTVAPEPDIVVADVAMPNCNGLELCRQVRQSPGLEVLPFIFLSARTLPQDRVAGLLVGADDYLTKPFETEELILRIEKRMQRVQPNLPSDSEFLDNGQTQVAVDGPDQARELVNFLLAPGSPIAKLSTAEREIFYWVTNGLSNRQIAEKMHLSMRTVQGHVANIRVKLNLSNRGAIIQFAREHHLI